MANGFRTIKVLSKGEYRDKGSKFFAFAHPVRNENEVKELLQSYRKEYYDARHVCSAFVIGPKGQLTRASDDGEPSNSAGAPILGQIKSFELTNVAVFVVRYFGGTKLGVPGLIQAYRESTKDALIQAQILTKYEEVKLTFHCELDAVNRFMYAVSNVEGTSILNQEYGSIATFEVSVRKSEEKKFRGLLEEFGDFECLD